MIPVSQPNISDEEKQAVMAVLESRYIVQGKRTAALEEMFATVCNVRYAIATSSGTSALHVALLAHGIGPGDEVITTAFTFIASANTILMCGAEPVFVDIEEDTFNLDVAAVEERITERTKAIMPVHLYGQPCAMDAVQAIADKYNLTIIEDACQAIGASYCGQPVGSFGTGAFSLYATKNVMAGEGGMITTNDATIADRCRLLRNHGMRERYEYELLGYNYRMTDIEAAIGVVQLQRLQNVTRQRRANAAFLNANIHSMITPRSAENREHVWHQYTVRTANGISRDKVVRELSNAGIGTGIFYPVPVHKYDHVRAVTGEVHLPVAEKVAHEVISLPIHPLVREEDLSHIAETVNLVHEPHFSG